MAQIELTQTHLLIKLTAGEKFFGLHGDFKIPAALIRGAEVADKDVWKTFGLRLPGTGFPGLLVYGSFLRFGTRRDPGLGRLDLCPLALQPPITYPDPGHRCWKPLQAHGNHPPRGQKAGRHHQRRDSCLLMEAYKPQYEGSPDPVALIGVHLAKKGLGSAFACDFKRISRKRAGFKALKDRYLADYGVQFETTSSSTGKEPCVLAKFDDGSTALLLDARDLALVNGDLKKFDQNLRAKLLFFF